MKLPKFFSLGAISLWFVVMALLPLLLIIMTSFLDHDANQLILAKFQLKNYLQLFDPLYFRILLHSLWLASVCTLFCLLLGYPAAYIIAQQPARLRPFLLLFLMIPFWTSSLIRTYATMALLKTKGLINSALLLLGLIDHPLQLLYTDTAVLIGMTYNLLPFMILPLYSNLEKLDKRLIEAAQDLGAKSQTIFLKIILPLSFPGIIAGFLMVFLPAMTLFYIPVLLGNAKSLLLGNLIETQFLTVVDWPGGSATSIVLTAMMFLLLFAYRKVSRHPSGQEFL